jgi:serine protease
LNFSIFLFDFRWAYVRIFLFTRTLHDHGITRRTKENLMLHRIRSKSFIVPALMALLVPACAEEDFTDIDTTTSELTEHSPDDRYIVKYANEAGRQAALASGKLARELPEQSAVAMYMPAQALKGLSNNPNIEYLEVDPRRYPMAEVTPYGITMVQTQQVPATSDAGRIKVCIIDSGLAGAHEDFVGLPITGTNDSKSGPWNVDLCGHGTHVAGTVAAVAGNNVGVVGVAPGASSLHIVKVFGDTCSWTYSSDLVGALNTCRNNGARVVSMSLGGSFKSKTEENAFANANNAGVLSIAAAGNSGNTQMSYPASYPPVVSVAAIDSTKALASFSQRNREVELAAPGVAVLSTYVEDNSLAVGGSKLMANSIANAATGTASGALVAGGRCTATSSSFSGKVVLCERGDISFYDKVMNVQNSGGLAAVIYNNASGNFYGTLGDGNTSTIPAISVSQEDGQGLVASSLGQTGTVTTGPGLGYAELDGTSMATPHVSGVAALIWAQAPNKTNTQVRKALTATAEDLGAAGRDNSFGYGLIRARAALDYLLAN